MANAFVINGKNSKSRVTRWQSSRAASDRYRRIMAPGYAALARSGRGASRARMSATMELGRRPPNLEVPSDRHSAEPAVPLLSPTAYPPPGTDHQGGPAAQPELRRVPGLRQAVRVRPEGNAHGEADRPFA